MKQEINFGIGFITGRPNICNIINSYYKDIINQVKELQVKVKFTFFILYDLNYLNTKEEEFYNIKPEVKEQITIKYLSPDYVVKKCEEISKKHNLSKEDANLLVGKGYARARNTILYEAVEQKIDYLFFWDDDEYPLAALREEKNIKWIKQKNILEHIKHIENTDVTYGYRCGMINPLPAVKYNEIITEEVYKQFVEAIENEAVSWDKLQTMLQNESGIGYANEQIATQKQGLEEMKALGKEDFVLGSGICLNLTHLEKIPAFYNPPEARGEDAFFSCALAELGAKAIRIPIYHFHDGFLKFTFLMEEKFPKRLKKITSEDSGISFRFKKTTTGWTKYKPLLYYILDKENYEQLMKTAKDKLNYTVPKMNTLFEDCDLTNLPNVLEDYDNKVQIHYNEYKQVNKIWNDIKYYI